jgi:hypothetical protein
MVVAMLFLCSAPASGVTVVIRRNIASNTNYRLCQLMILFQQKAHEDALDRLTFIAQSADPRRIK